MTLSLRAICDRPDARCGLDPRPRWKESGAQPEERGHAQRIMLTLDDEFKPIAQVQHVFQRDLRSFREELRITMPGYALSQSPLEP